MARVTTVIDVVRFSNETPADAIKDLVGKLSVEHEILSERSGATIWPTVRFTGETKMMRQLLERYCGGFPQELERQLLRLSPVD